MKKIYLITLLLSLSTSCSTNYWSNRRNDLMDIAHIHVDSVAAGGTINVSSLSLGYYGVTGVNDDNGSRVKLGLGGIDTVQVSGFIEGVGEPINDLEVRSEWGYGGTVPSYGSIGFNLGYLVSIGAKVDALELIDFLAGIFTLDLVADDKTKTTEQED